MTHSTCRLTAKNRDQLQNPTLDNRVWATFTFAGPTAANLQQPEQWRAAARWNRQTRQTADRGFTCVRACVHSGFNFTSASRDDVDTLQKIVETFKFGYAERTYLGDEMFANVSEVCLCCFYILYFYSLFYIFYASSPVLMPADAGGVGQNRRFSTNSWLYLENGTR